MAAWNALSLSGISDDDDEEEEGTEAADSSELLTGARCEGCDGRGLAAEFSLPDARDAAVCLRAGAGLRTYTWLRARHAVWGMNGSDVRYVGFIVVARTRGGRGCE